MESRYRLLRDLQVGPQSHFRQPQPVCRCLRALEVHERQRPERIRHSRRYLRDAVPVLQIQLFVFVILGTEALQSPRRRAEIIHLIDQRIENLKRPLRIVT